jgi:hypothetical protein
MLVVIRYCPEMQLGLLKRYNALTKDTYTPIYNNRRFSHTWVLGKIGVGKTTALVRWALDDIYNGEGLAFFDRHGDAIEEILSRTLPARRSDVIIYDPSDFDHPIAFNVFYNVSEFTSILTSSHGHFPLLFSKLPEPCSHLGSVSATLIFCLRSSS